MIKDFLNKILAWLKTFKAPKLPITEPRASESIEDTGFVRKPLGTAFFAKDEPLETRLDTIDEPTGSEKYTTS